jgi:hypothetical protein
LFGDLRKAGVNTNWSFGIVEIQEKTLDSTVAGACPSNLPELSKPRLQQRNPVGRVPSGRKREVGQHSAQGRNVHVVQALAGTVVPIDVHTCPA